MKARRYRYGVALVAIPLFFSFLIYHALHVDLPTHKAPTKLYSNQTRNDLRLVTLSALKSAKKSIYLKTYALTDSSVKKILTKKAQEGVDVRVTFDARTTKKLPSELNPNPIKDKGLMHEKIIVIDDSLVILGSANMTTTSLQMHDNLLLATQNKPLAAALKNNSPYPNLYRLPSSDALDRLTTELENAKTSIEVAMFTFTHQELCDALIYAHKKGVKIDVTIDSVSGKGASKKVYARLKESGVDVRLSKGLQLYHHKWALIDKERLIIGSANWTKAAFTKNHDYFLIVKKP